MDWITARASCALETLFMLLFEVVDSDVKKANKLGLQGAKFEINEPAHGKFLVYRAQRMPGGGESGPGVTFELNDSNITVRDRDASNFVQGSAPRLTVTPYVIENGQCRVRIDNDSQPRELWEVSRQALERLIFQS
jgi:hypothetical protein